MGFWQLRFSILGTLAIIIGVSTLFFTVILSLLSALNYVTLAIFVVFFNLIQWLTAPYLIDRMYRIKEVSRNDNPELYGMVEGLSRKSGIKAPKVMISHIPIPNAFAYGSPIAGTRVAVTKSLLKTLDRDKIEAVLGHELGHLKHKDVQVMMFVSILPSLFYFIGYSMLLSSAFGRRNDRSSGTVVIGLASMVLYWVLTLLILYLSRLREYFADHHSVMIVENGSSNLSEALASIQYSTGKFKMNRRDASGFQSLRTLFISDPGKAESDYSEISRMNAATVDQSLVNKLLKKEITTADRITELFSTHPNIIKRLKALQELD